jgi:LmbE family N-acetylglucosaminyl deacetylase
LDEGLEPWQGIKELWLMGPGPLEGEVVTVDVTGTIERKIEALRCHTSQLSDWDPSEMMRARARERGAEHGFEYGEGFLRVIRQGRPTVATTPKETTS